MPGSIESSLSNDGDWMVPEGVFNPPYLSGAAVAQAPTTSDNASAVASAWTVRRSMSIFRSSRPLCARAENAPVLRRRGRVLGEAAAGADHRRAEWSAVRAGDDAPDVR